MRSTSWKVLALHDPDTSGEKAPALRENRKVSEESSPRRVQFTSLREMGTGANIFHYYVRFLME